MQLNIPKTSTVSHELPIFTELSQSAKIPVSEVKARFHQEMVDQHRKAMDDPSMLPMDSDGDTIRDMAVSSLSQSLEHPEEEVDEDKEYNDLFNLDPGEPDPSAGQFGIDNMDLGFSDDGMSSLDGLSDTMDDFGSEPTGDDVNAISDIEPGATDEESPAEDAEDASTGDESNDADFADPDELGETI